MKKKTLFALLLAAVMLLSGCSLVLKDSAVDAKQTIIDVNGEQVDKQTFLNAYNYTLTMQQYYAQMLQQFGGDGTVDEASILQSTLDNYISSLVLSQKAKELGFDQFTDAELAELQAQAQEEYDTQLESIRTTYFADSELEGDALTAEVTAYAKANGIDVKNTPRASSQSVAELAMGHMFACARYLSIAGHTMREGKWEKKAYGKGIELQGKTLGIVGFGRIGQHLGVMAKAIGMKVIAFDIYQVPVISEQLDIPYVEMDELLAKSDFISVHAPAVDGGALINAERIAKMKDGVVIINTSRGSNVDEDALLAALESGKVRAAGLDVYADEPASNVALYSHPMVSCTPHIGAATVEAQKRIGTEIVDIIRSF